MDQASNPGGEKTPGVEHRRDVGRNAASVPMMIRTRHIRGGTQPWGMLKIFQLDQGCRAVAEGMGVREFRWGDLVEGYNL
jgi:hypothetical protein